MRIFNTTFLRHFFFIHVYLRSFWLFYVSRACAVFVIKDDVITYIYGRTQWHKIDYISSTVRIIPPNRLSDVRVYITCIKILWCNNNVPALRRHADAGFGYTTRSQTQTTYLLKWLNDCVRTGFVCFIKSIFEIIEISNSLCNGRGQIIVTMMCTMRSPDIIYRRVIITSI